jgi:hypothetical protein
MNDCRLVGQDAILPGQVGDLPHDNHWFAGPNAFDSGSPKIPSIPLTHSPSSSAFANVLGKRCSNHDMPHGRVFHTVFSVVVLNVVVD